MGMTCLDDRGQLLRIDLMARVGVQVHRVRFLVVNFCLTHISGVVFVQVQHADISHCRQLRRWRGWVRFNLAVCLLWLLLVMLLLLLHLRGGRHFRLNFHQQIFVGLYES